MIPTEHEGTVAVEAAAREWHRVSRLAAERLGKHLPPLWEDLTLLEQRNLKQQALGFVWAALEALPDRRDAVRSLVDTWSTKHDTAKCDRYVCPDCLSAAFTAPLLQELRTLVGDS